MESRILLVGGLERDSILVSIQLGNVGKFILPTDGLIFFRGGHKNHQADGDD